MTKKVKTPWGLGRNSPRRSRRSMNFSRSNTALARTDLTQGQRERIQRAIDEYVEKEKAILESEGPPSVRERHYPQEFTIKKPEGEE